MYLIKHKSACTKIVIYIIFRNYTLLLSIPIQNFICVYKVYKKKNYRVDLILGNKINNGNNNKINIGR